MTDSLPTVPTHETALRLIEEALQAGYEVDDNGDHVLVGAEYTLEQILMFWSGYDETLEVQEGNVTVYDYPTLTYRDIITSLINEVRILRGASDSDPALLELTGSDDSDVVTYVGWFGKTRTVQTEMSLGRGVWRTPPYGLRRAIWDAAFGYVSGFRKRDILYYLLTRSLSKRVERVALDREAVLR